ncbi:mitochondrial ATP synthase g subunit-domain-containing protein [Blastocladiella britannica]|nr:mitochondrial ATP synthase g subunit-domain-containing protein [Blastocladiella britannica]
MSFSVATVRAFAEAGLRRASTLAQGVNANQVVSRAAAALEPVTYRIRVVGEVAKLVYKAERLAPPTQATLAEAQQVGQSLVQSVRQGAYKSWATADMAKGAVLAGEAFTFFLLGEIVGRRNLVGYAV